MELDYLVLYNNIYSEKDSELTRDYKLGIHVIFSLDMFGNLN